jgi:hypothetical protein|tara:strand:+ start:8431 stop:9105 length:675 start_codon:yes stop_codon:yes gene_type:complete
MKLSDQTLEVLKNFSDINTNILVKPGSELSTISTMKNILAKATITESFDKQFAVYDLSELLGIVSAIEKPDVDISNEKFMTIGSTGSKSKAKYYYSDESVVTSPQKDVVMPDADVNFQLKDEILSKLLKMAAIMKLPDLSLVGKKGQDVILKVHDKKNSANSYEEFVGTEASADFTFNFKIENLKIIPGDYDVAVSSKSISHFKNKVKPIEYWIALEPDSKISK